MDETGGWVVLDAHLPRSVRSYLEERFWRPIEAQATLEVLCEDPAFLADPGRHPAIFADHGVVHVRDVAIGLVRLLDTIDGVLIPGRPADRRQFLETLGVAAAYLHDIGMVDMTAMGRRMHPIFAAGAAFGADIDPLVDHLLAPGPVRERLDVVATTAPFEIPLDVVVREMLSLTVTHSKSTVPAALLDDREALRRLMQRVVFTDLDDHRASGRMPSAADPDPIRFEANVARYADPSRSYAWLSASNGPQAELADDVLDTMRALRAADVLRQRGSVLRTSGGFELCMDAETARAVCTMRTAAGDAAYVIAYDDERGAGEANIRVAFVTPRGDLRLAFHRGAFATDVAARRAAASVAGVVADIAADVIPTFGGPAVGGGSSPATRSMDDVRIQLERPDDHPGFADDVAALLAERDPSLAARLVTVANVEGAAPDERRRFYAAEPLDAFGPQADDVVRRMADHGVYAAALDRAAAFAEVGRATIQPGEVLVARGSPPSFVYVPTGPGLVVRPDGGYAPSPLHAWLPVGTTGVIRRNERNSDIVAEREVDVIMIPGDLYATTWLAPLPVEELAARLRPRAALS